jgi:hypothetical protein
MAYGTRVFFVRNASGHVSLATRLLLLLLSYSTVQYRCARQTSFVLLSVSERLSNAGVELVSALGHWNESRRQVNFYSESARLESD